VWLGQPSTGEVVRAELTAFLEEPAVEDGSAVGGRPSAVGGRATGVASSAVAGALRVPADTQLLLITSRYRFLLITARQLADLREAGLDIENIHRFAAREAVIAVVNWTAAREMERLLLVTSTGYARAYPIDTLRAAIEGPVPFGFDTPPPGVPVLAQGIRRDWDVLLVTEGGRAVRWPLARIPLSGLQALNPGQGEAFDRVVTALAAAPGNEMTLLLADGYARRVKLEWVEEAAKANVKGKALVARQAATVTLADTGALELVTNRRVLAADSATLLLEDSTKAFRLVKLESEEAVTAVIR